MRKYNLEGDFKEEAEKQLEKLNAISDTITDLSETKRILKKKFWDYLRKEFPNMSDNCTITNEDGKLIFIDRLAD